eukprot:6609323-Pyramimonas_sp.AAC.1
MQKCIERAELLSEWSSYANARRKNLLFQNKWSLSFKKYPKPPKSYHVVRLGRVDQLGSGSKPSTRFFADFAVDCAGFPA